MSEERAPYVVQMQEDDRPRPALGTWLRHRSGIEGPFVGEIRIGGRGPLWCVEAQWPDATVTHYAAPPAGWERVPACSMCGSRLVVRAANDWGGGAGGTGSTNSYWCPHCDEARDP